MVQRDTPPDITPTTFSETITQKATLHVPKGCKGVYWIADNWSAFSNIADDVMSIRVADGCTDSESISNIYDLNGISRKQLSKGLNIIRKNNGERVKKIVR